MGFGQLTKSVSRIIKDDDERQDDRTTVCSLGLGRRAAATIFKTDQEVSHYRPTS